MKRSELEKLLNDYLKPDQFRDYCPNGLQVEGKEDIGKVVTGVSASIELFKHAIDKNADAIIVHHGIIWYKSPYIIKGSFKERIKLLLQNDINLFAYHLPLDAHPEIGNNAIIAKELGLKDVEPFGIFNDQNIGIKGKIEPCSFEDFFEMIKAKINAKAIFFPFGSEVIKTIGIISGAAQKELRTAVEEGLDLYLTGEVSEETYHLAKEERIHFVAAGHTATEEFGIKALTEFLKQNSSIDAEFIKIENPI